VLKGVKARSFTERFHGLLETVSSECLKEGVSGSDPFEIVLFSDLSILRAARIPIGQCGQLPISILFIEAERRWGAGRIEGVREARYIPEIQGHILCRLAKESGNGFRNTATLSGPGSALHKHIQIEFLECKSFESILTYGPVLPLTHVP
jgi:hypothetical protein